MVGTSGLCLLTIPAVRSGSVAVAVPLLLLAAAGAMGGFANYFALTQEVAPRQVHAHVRQPAAVRPAKRVQRRPGRLLHQLADAAFVIDAQDAVTRRLLAADADGRDRQHRLLLAVGLEHLAGDAHHHGVAAA